MNSEPFIKFIGIITIITGLVLATTSFTSIQTSQTWYVVLVYFMSACTIASGIILFITKSFKEVSK